MHEEARPGTLYSVICTLNVSPIVGIALLAMLSACTSRELREQKIREQVAIVAAYDGELAEEAIERLVRYGPAVIPEIEAALPKATFTGQLNLVLALRRLGDEEAIPLLMHIALRNEFGAVRIESMATLQIWSRGRGRLAERAQEALRLLEERASQRGKG